MADFRLNYNSISDLRRCIPPANPNGDISIIIERDNLLELLRGYERYLEYTKALKQLEVIFQRQLNGTLKRQQNTSDLRERIKWEIASIALRGHRDFITAILWD